MKTSKLTNQEFWGLVILLSLFMICTSCMVIGLFGEYIIRFEIDANTLEAIKSVNWSAIPR